MSVGILTGGLWGGPSVVAPTLAADSALFRPNPLINPVLEQFRIWDQEYADNVKYGGELERGDAGNKGKVDAYPRLLVPILAMADDLDRIHKAVMDGRSTFPLAITILQQPKFTKTEFKKVFNAYADNIYYSDPDRANLYLAGGATPRSEQSLAYLLRNDILTHVEDLLAELIFLEKSVDEDTADAKAMAESARNAMQKYLSSIVPPDELASARRLYKEQSSL